MQPTIDKLFQVTDQLLRIRQQLKKAGLDPKNVTLR